VFIRRPSLNSKWLAHGFEWRSNVDVWYYTLIRIWSCGLPTIICNNLKVNAIFFFFWYFGSWFYFLIQLSFYIIIDTIIIIYVYFILSGRTVPKFETLEQHASRYAIFNKILKRYSFFVGSNSKTSQTMNTLYNILYRLHVHYANNIYIVFFYTYITCLNNVVYVILII